MRKERRTPTEADEEQGKEWVRGTHCKADASAPENVPPHRKGNELV